MSLLQILPAKTNVEIGEIEAEPRKKRREARMEKSEELRGNERS
jgi:hypothetical protein